MCGIAGIVNLTEYKPVAEGLLRAMADTMVHRGPNDSGVWVSDDRQTGMSHRRLSIVDLSPAGRQPMTNEDGSVWVTFNGEIYNFRQLRLELENKGHRFRSNTDTEVLVHLYEEHGNAFVEALDGDFAIGLWDDAKKRLVLCRDRVGVKPLYYIRTQYRLYFASEIKALLQAADVEARLNKRAFYHYLSYLVAPTPHTMVRGVKKLPPAGILVVQQGDTRVPDVRLFWEALPRRPQLSENLDEQLKSLFESSVRKRLMSDVPLGLLFSGGVDSTLNLCIFSALRDAGVAKTFTVTMETDGDFLGDREHAREMAKVLGSDHHEIRITNRDMVEVALKLAGIQDEPISDPTNIPHYFVTRLARESGCTVLQAGEGADELFCGYDKYLRFMRYEEKYWRPLSKLPRFVPAMASGALRIMKTSSRLRKIQDSLSRMAKGQKFFLSSVLAFYEGEKRCLLSRHLLDELGDTDSFEVVVPYYERLHEHKPQASLLDAMTYIDLNVQLPELLLMRADKMSMANSVEVRVPFLDRDLIDFALSVPQSFKLRDGVLKEPLKRLASQYVPRERVYRPKIGFGTPVLDWFKKGELRDDFVAQLHVDRTDIGLLFDVKQIENKLHHGLTSVNDAFQLWTIYNFLKWKQAYAVQV